MTGIEASLRVGGRLAQPAFSCEFRLRHPMLGLLRGSPTSYRRGVGRALPATCLMLCGWAGGDSDALPGARYLAPGSVTTPDIVRPSHRSVSQIGYLRFGEPSDNGVESRPLASAARAPCRVSGCWALHPAPGR
jgi:hypothetical protein